MNEMIDYVRRTDSHASTRIGLLERAGELLSSSRAGSEEALELSEKLERWRYQSMDVHKGPRDSQLLQLEGLLEELIRKLRGLEHLPPRQTALKVGDSDFFSQPIGEALSLLDSAIPLNEVLKRAEEVTRRHFQTESGRRRILLYAPLYLSSYCVNHCLYCGFRYPNQIEREHISYSDIEEQSEILLKRGFRHILLVSGDFPKLTTTEYHSRAVELVRGKGAQVALEIAPQTYSSYKTLRESGAYGITLYQETYRRDLYSRYHPRGPKSFYHWRLEGPDRLAEAGFPRVGLGILLGLAPPKEELASLMRHAAYLKERFPNLKISFSLPRIYEAPDSFDIPHPVDDELFIRMYSALRIAFPDAELVLSTREPPALRDTITPIFITQISAESSTVPGGYSEDHSRDRHSPDSEQFPVHDDRSVGEIVKLLESSGLEVRWVFDE